MAWAHWHASAFAPADPDSLFGASAAASGPAPLPAAPSPGAASSSFLADNTAGSAVPPLAPRPTLWRDEFRHATGIESGTSSQQNQRPAASTHANHSSHSHSRKSTSFYLDCVQKTNCPTLGGKFFCPCNSALEAFANRVELDASVGEQLAEDEKCDPLSYYYEVGKEKWWKCCAQPNPQNPKVPGAGTQLGKVAAKVMPGRGAFGAAWDAVSGALPNVNYCQEMRPSSRNPASDPDTVTSNADPVRETKSSLWSYVGLAGTYSLPGANQAKAIQCLAPRALPELYTDSYQCVCWGKREECINLGKYGRKVPGWGSPYNVFFV